MIQAFALAAICQAAEQAGVPANQVMTLSASDNLTLPRPRIEYQILPAKYRRTGRKLAIRRENKANPVQTVKRELYEVDLDISVNALAPDTGKDADAAVAWLSAFTQAFVTAFPRGGNDAAGNWVSIRVQRASMARQPDKRVGETAIRVFTKMGTVFLLTFCGRITTEEEQKLITHVTINLPAMGKGV